MFLLCALQLLFILKTFNEIKFSRDMFSYKQSGVEEVKPQDLNSEKSFPLL